MSPAAPLLEARELCLRIAGRTLVESLSVRVRAGELWCILGANGVGKSTFLDAVVGLRAADGGEVRIAGQLVAKLDARESARIRAYLPQAFGDAFSARVLDVVMLGRHPHLARWAWEDDSDRVLALAALDAVGLAGMEARDIATLSGGERQRAAIAALLVQEAPLLLLDEPVAHLDLHHQSGILAHLQALALSGKHAVVFTVHDLNLAARYATHVMLFHEGGAVQAGPVGEVMGEAALSAAFHCPVQQLRVGCRNVFVVN